MSALRITVHEPDVVFTDLGLAILAAWYHMVQASALVLLYVGFRRVADSAAEGYGDGTAPAPGVG